MSIPFIPLMNTLLPQQSQRFSNHVLPTHPVTPLLPRDKYLLSLLPAIFPPYFHPTPTRRSQRDQSLKLLLHRLLKFPVSTLDLRHLFRGETGQ